MKHLLITLILLSAVTSYGQTYRNYGATNSSEISRTYGASFWPFYGGHGDSVLIMVSNDGTVSYTSKSGIAVTIDTTSLSNRINERIKYADTGVVVPSMYDFTTGLADKINTSAISQNPSDNNANTVPSSAALFNGLAGKQDALGYVPENVANKTTNVVNSSSSYPSGAGVTSALFGKVDTGAYGVLVFNQAQLTAALSNGTRNIVIADSFSTTAQLSIPSNTTITGLRNGKAKISMGSGNTLGIFKILNASNISISGVELIGTGATVDKNSSSIIAADSQIITQVNIGTSRGIDITGSEIINIDNVYIHNFTNAGVYTNDIGDHADVYGHGVTLTNSFFDNCYYGVWCYTRSEYSSFSNLSIRYCVAGFAKFSGNIILDASRVTDNRINYVSGPGTNNSHGGAVNCEFNHAGLRAIYMQDITGGETITGCSIFEGDCWFRRCLGLNMTGTAIAAAMRFDGGILNKISQCMFFKVYNGGTNTAINGGVYVTRGNDFSDGSDNAVINNTGNFTLQNVMDNGISTTKPIAFMSTYNTNLVQPVTFNVNAAQSHSILIQHASTGLTGGVTMTMEVSGFMYGTPGTYFKGYITIYPSNATTIATTAQSATFLINGALLTNPPRVVAAMSNSKITVALADTTQAWPAGSWVRLDNVTTSNTGTQGVNTFWQTGWTMDSTTTNVGFTSTKVITPKVLLSDAPSSVTSTQIRDTTIVAGDMKPFSNRSSAATLTLTYANDYTFIGTTTTWTLPAIAAATLGRAQSIRVKNAGSGNITLNTNAAANVLYTTTLTNTMNILPGEAYTFRPDGTIFAVE